MGATAIWQGNISIASTRMQDFGTDLLGSFTADMLIMLLDNYKVERASDIRGQCCFDCLRWDY